MKAGLLLNPCWCFTVLQLPYVAVPRTYVARWRWFFKLPWRNPIACWIGRVPGWCSRRMSDGCKKPCSKFGKLQLSLLLLLSFLLLSIVSEDMIFWHIEAIKTMNSCFLCLPFWWWSVIIPWQHAARETNMARGRKRKTFANCSFLFGLLKYLYGCSCWRLQGSEVEHNESNNCSCCTTACTLQNWADSKSH